MPIAYKKALTGKIATHIIDAVEHCQYQCIFPEWRTRMRRDQQEAPSSARFRQWLSAALLMLTASAALIPDRADATIVLSQIFTEASGATPGDDYFVLAPSFSSPNSVIAQGSASATGAFGTTASAKSIADGPGGHIGAYGQGSAVHTAVGLVSIGGGASGKITYVLTLDPGDSLLVRFSVNGSLVGDAGMTASIFNELSTIPLSGSIACTPDFCTAPHVQDFLLAASGPGPTAVRLTSTLGVSAGFGEALFSEANFFNSLDVALIAPLGTEIVDPYGVIAVPEPATFLLLAIGLGLVICLGRSQRQLSRRMRKAPCQPGLAFFRGFD